MKKVYEDVVKKEEIGCIFACRLTDGYEYKIQVDKNGEVIMADYGSMSGWCTRSKGESGFENAVHIAMSGILENDKNEFIQMRSYLNEKFRDIAESIRKSKASQWDF